MSDETSAVLELDDELQKNLREARKYVVGEGEGVQKKSRPVVTLALVAFAWTVAAFALGVVYDAGGVAKEIQEQGRKLDSALLKLQTIEAAQRESDLGHRTLLGRVNALEKQLTEARSDVSTLERQMTYRLQMEAAIRQLHPGVNWP